MKEEINILEINPDLEIYEKIKDDHLQMLLSKAYRGEILCRRALIKMSAIRPHTDFQPEIDSAFQKYFMEQADKKEYLPLLVYQQDNLFIMSDDYNVYALYKKFKFENVPCDIIGEITNQEDIVDIGEPFHLESPKSAIVINN